MLKIFRTLLGKNKETRKAKSVTTFDIYKDLEYLYKHQSPNVKTFGGGYSGRTYELVKDKWKINVHRSYSKRYKLEIFISLEKEEYLPVCIMNQRDERIQFLQDGEWSNLFYEFYATVPYLLKEARKQEIKWLQSKENYLINYTSENIKKYSIPEIMFILRNLHAMGDSSVSKNTFGEESYIFHHEDFKIELVNWGAFVFEPPTYRTEIHCYLEEGRKVAIVDSYDDNKKINWKYDGIWNEYFLMLISDLEKRVVEYWDKNEEKLKKIKI